MTLGYLWLLIFIFLSTISEKHIVIISSYYIKNSNSRKRDTYREQFLCFQEKSFPYVMIFITLLAVILLLGNFLVLQINICYYLLSLFLRAH